MAKTVSISEETIIAMLREVPESTLMDMFSKMLVESDTSPLTDEENASYREALKEHERGELVSCHDVSSEEGNMTKVGDLTIDELEHLIEQKILEVLGDPDCGLELRDEVKERLRGSLAAAERGQKPLSMDEVARLFRLHDPAEDIYTVNDGEPV